MGRGGSSVARLLLVFESGLNGPARDVIGRGGGPMAELIGRFSDRTGPLPREFGVSRRSNGSFRRGRSLALGAKEIGVSRGAEYEKLELVLKGESVEADSGLRELAVDPSRNGVADNGRRWSAPCS